MFSNLGNIQLHKPRQAETADTRLGIGRHEKDAHQNKSGKDKDEDFFDQEDSTTVSIEALRVFLLNFLKSQQEAESKESAPQINTAVASPAPSSEAAQAAGAYAATAKANERTEISAEETATQEMLSTEDTRRMLALLETLKFLEQNGVEFLAIERGESFLSSLINAAEKAKSAL